MNRKLLEDKIKPLAIGDPLFLHHLVRDTGHVVDRYRFKGHDLRKHNDFNRLSTAYQEKYDVTLYDMFMNMNRYSQAVYDKPIIHNLL